MKGLLVITICCFSAILMSSCAQSEPTPSAQPAVSSAATSSENVDQILRDLEQEWVNVILKRDNSGLDRILADDYTATTWDGRTESKAESLESQKSGTYTAESMVIDGVKVKTFGDVGIVTLGQTEKSQNRGKDTSGRYLFTDVWVKRNGRWQVVSSHGTRVEQTKP